MARKLKVFQAQFGFYETVVAAPSQAAALRAWGTHQNLFASGEATPATDAAAVEAATAHPETVLKRPVGSKGAYEVDPSGLPDVPPAKPKPRPKVTKPTATTKTTPEPPTADRTALTKAEAALHDIDADRKAEETDLRQREAALDADKAAAQDAYVAARKAATATVVAARQAYRDAGGRD
ncbi:MAG: hypothetical protein JO303_12150 [Caulobacteraceae bacterium]|nr:hypothetical protein [Caulobacteraceae bacterium]